MAAVTGTYRNKHMKAEDTTTVLVGFANGVTGLVRTSWAMPLPAGHSAFHVVGEHGELYGPANELFWKPNRFAEPARQTFKEVDTFEVQITHFIECIEHAKQPVQSWKDGIRVLKLIRKSYEFVESQKART